MWFATVVRHGGRISKLIDYKGTKIRGYQAPFTVTGPPELLRIGYACGFGDRNSQGFGMVEVARQAAPQTP
jgi:CRISPR-associated endoribonuclease Cas6